MANNNRSGKGTSKRAAKKRTPLRVKLIGPEHEVDIITQETKYLEPVGVDEVSRTDVQIVVTLEGSDDLIIDIEDYADPCRAAVLAEGIRQLLCYGAATLTAPAGIPATL